VFAVGGHVQLGERFEPGADPRLDRVDERAVEIEDQSARIGQAREVGAQRLPRRIR